MAVVTILGIDPAMNNVGYMLLQLDTENELRSTAPESADWIKLKDTTGKHTYRHFTRLAGGTLEGPDTNWFERIQTQADSLHEIIGQLKPDIIAIESQLDKGDSKSPTGVALQHLILAPYFRVDKKYYTRVHIDTDDQVVLTQSYEPMPKFVVLLYPPRVQSVAHCERSTKGRIVVNRYKQMVPEDKHRLSQHEADAFYIGVHCGRFWATCLTECWPKSYLTEKERYVFLEGPKAMINQRNEVWWKLPGS